MNNQTLADIIGTTNGKVFSVDFTKKDGTSRHMNCRLGVKKHLRGGKSTTSHKTNLVTVFDMQAGDYRCINLDTVTHIRLGGVDLWVKSDD